MGQGDLKARFHQARYDKNQSSDTYTNKEFREVRQAYLASLSRLKRLRYNLTGVPSQGRRFTLKHFGWSRTLALIVLLAVVLWQVL